MLQVFVRNIASGQKNMEQLLQRHEATINNHTRNVVAFYNNALTADIAQGQRKLEDQLDAHSEAVNNHTSNSIAYHANAMGENFTKGLDNTRDAILTAIGGRHNGKMGVESHAILDLINCGDDYRWIDSRREQVMESHGGTFEWIFDARSMERPIRRFNSRGQLVDNSEQPSKEHHSTPLGVQEDLHTCGLKSEVEWDCFACWLAQPPGQLFWFCGKAGSGKSTLVKFVVQKDKTMQCLRAAHGQVLVLSHFIWLSGQPIQRSLRGILLSLLQQFVSYSHHERESGETAFVDQRVEFNGAMDAFTKSQPAGYIGKSPIRWPYKGLRDCVLKTLAESPVTLCLFIDGLDEVKDDEVSSGLTTPVLELIDSLRALPRVKVCVSSRPEPAFRQKYESCPKLQLQYLIRGDIMTYVVENFRPHLERQPSEHGLANITKKQIALLAHNIWKYSDGVFLWVCLVTRSLLRGLESGDTVSELEERLAQLPRDITELYRTMWQRMDKDDQALYQSRAALYINMALDSTQQQSFYYSGEPFWRMEYLFTAQIYGGLFPEMIRRIYADSGEHLRDRVVQACLEFGKSIEAKTAGLLEASSPSGRDIGSVHFIHRSAKEFFENTDSGKEILVRDQSTKESRRFVLFRGLLFDIWIKWFQEDYDDLDPLKEAAEKYPGQLEVYLEHLEIAFDQHLLDRKMVICLLQEAQTMYYAALRMIRLAPRRAVLTFDDGPDGDIVGDNNFNTLLARFGNEKFLAFCVGVDLEDEVSIARLEQCEPLAVRFPAVLSHDYKWYLLYQVLSHVGGNIQRTAHRCLASIWLMDVGLEMQKLKDTWTPQRFHPATVLLNRCAGREDTIPEGGEDSVLTLLEECLLLDGAWEERPVLALWQSGKLMSDFRFRNPIEAVIQGTDNPFSYMLWIQATMGFAVSLFIESIRGCVDVEQVEPLEREIRRRYPDGPPPAEIFAMFFTEEYTYFPKRDMAAAIHIPGREWSQLPLDWARNNGKKDAIVIPEQDARISEIEMSGTWTTKELSEEVKRRMLG